MQENREQIKKWLKDNKLTREWLAEKTFSTKGTVDKWMSKIDIPKAKLALILSIMEEWQNGDRQKQEEEEECTFVIKCSAETFRKYSDAALENGMTINDFLLNAARSYIRQTKVERPRPYAKSPQDGRIKDNIIWGKRPKGDIA